MTYAPYKAIGIQTKAATNTGRLFSRPALPPPCRRPAAALPPCRRPDPGPGFPFFGEAFFCAMILYGWFNEGRFNEGAIRGDSLSLREGEKAGAFYSPSFTFGGVFILFWRDCAIHFLSTPWIRYTMISISASSSTLLPQVTFWRNRATFRIKGGNPAGSLSIGRRNVSGAIVRGEVLFF
jgi:hypothetical protein